MKKFALMILAGPILSPAYAQEDVKSIDLAVTPKAYIGKRIRITGVITGAMADSGMLELQGGSAYVDFHGTEDRESIKGLIRDCSSFFPTPRCKRVVIATVSPSGPSIKLTDATILPVQPPQPRPASAQPQQRPRPPGR